MLARLDVPEELRPAEPELSIVYDEQGFRNPPDLTDWEVVVAGGSMTELGHLAYEDLFTTRAGALLGVRVKNLGVRGAGPLAAAHFLREYGVAPSARHAVLALFEGDDLDALLREGRARKPLPSPAEGERKAVEAADPEPAFAVNAHWLHGETRVPISLRIVPRTRGFLTGEVREQLDQALGEWAEAARAADMHPWLLFLPSKRRVLRSRLEFEPGADPALVEWQLSRFPDVLRRMAKLQGIDFVTPIGRLRRAMKAGRLSYSPIWDEHLNQYGAEVVADVLAHRLSKPPRASRRSARHP